MLASRLYPSVRALVVVIVAALSLAGCRSSQPGVYESWGQSLDRMRNEPFTDGRGYTEHDVSLMLGTPPSKREQIVDPRAVGSGWWVNNLDPKAAPTVMFVLPGSSAAEVGIAPGDTVLALDGEPVRSVADILAFGKKSPAKVGTVRKVRTSRGEFVTTATLFPVEQIYWEVSAGGVMTAGSGAYVNTQGGAAASHASSRERFFRATCRFASGVLVEASWNWQQ